MSTTASTLSAEAAETIFGYGSFDDDHVIKPVD
jgi:hypothetical protein